MTQLFDDKGDVHPVTVLQAGPCVVTQRKTCNKDGYDAAQIGLVEFVKESRLTKADAGTLRQEQSSAGEVPARSSPSWQEAAG